MLIENLSNANISAKGKILTQTHMLLEGNYLSTQSHNHIDANEKGQLPQGTTQSACPHVQRQTSCGTGLVWSVRLSPCEVQFYDTCLCVNLISLCTNRHVGKCFDQTLTNEREQDKRRAHAEHRMGFLRQSVSNLLSHTVPHLDDTQNRHAEGISDSCIDKVIMCIK